jgi:hypothetical protein
MFFPATSPNRRAGSEASEPTIHDGLAERARTLYPDVEVDSAYERLDSVGEHIRLLSLAGRVRAAPKPQRAAEPNVSRPLGKRLCVHERRAHERQRPFVGARVARHQQLADADTEQRVAEEFETLIVETVGKPLLVREARMRERLDEVRQIRR